MMTKDEELALDLALRSLKELVPDESDYAPAIQGQRKRQEKAIAAIKQARALDKKADNAHWGNEDLKECCHRSWNAAIKQARSAPMQEPVVFYRCNGCGHAYEQVHPTSCDCMEAGGFDRVEYYTTPPAQPAPAPGYCKHCKQYSIEEPLPAAHQQWIGLTDDEIIDVIHPLVMADMPDQATDYEIARAIEAKLKEKNT
jgi:DNA-directed RNA polymerase subunit M/transcription elongation factor TFIIS